MKDRVAGVWGAALFAVLCLVPGRAFSFEVDAEQNKRLKVLEDRVSRQGGGGGDVEGLKKEIGDLKKQIEALKYGAEIDQLKKDVSEIGSKVGAQSKDAPKSAGGFLNTTYGSLTMRGILQVQYDRGEKGTPYSQFLVKRARLIFSGQTPVKQVSYFIQTDAVGEIFLLDAKAMFSTIPRTTVNVGRFVPNFTYYMPRTTADLDLIQYPLLVTKYAPWRQVGIQLDTKFKYVNFNAGVFNGFPSNSWSDNNEAKDFLGRVGITPMKDLEFFGYRWEGREVSGAAMNLLKNRTGGGFSFRYDRLNVVSEYVQGYDESSAKKVSQGAYGNLGVKVLPWMELVSRYDWYDADLKADRDLEQWLTLGGNFFLDGNRIKLSVNYIYKKEEPADAANDEFVGQIQLFF